MADNSLRQLLETLASNPQVLEKLLVALLITLTKQMRMSQGQEGNTSAGDIDSVDGHMSNVGHVIGNGCGNEANTSGNNPTPNSGVNRHSNVAVNGGGNDTIDSSGNKTDHSSSEANCHGNEAAIKSNMYGACNSYAHRGTSFNDTFNGNYYQNTASWSGSNHYRNPYFAPFNQQWTQPLMHIIKIRGQVLQANQPTQSVT